MTPETLGVAAIIYVAGMFVLAHAADRAASAGRWRWMDSPVIYTLSLSVYCSAWTFYGAVGYASRSGLEFMTIYLGPGIVFAGAWWGLRHLVRVARMHRVTSIADLISSRFGKSPGLAALVTLIAVTAATPYIALQLQSVSMALSAFSDGPALSGGGALWTGIGLAAFAILFGTRNLAADERHHGVVMAIALEAVVKLAAFIAVGVFVLWGLADGPGDVLARIDRIAASPEGAGWIIKPDRWAVLIALSGAAVIVLPRMFQVMVVEASDDDRLRHAGWAFPLYLFIMSFLVLPIAVVGRDLLPASANPDLYVLELPLLHGRDGLAAFVFIGGFSSAMSMVVVSAIAVSTMMANHWLVPFWLWLRGGLHAQPLPGTERGDLRKLMLNARRLAILAIIGAGWSYHHLSGGTSALAVMGIVAFSGMAQVLPAMVAGLIWRGATRRGATCGIAAGALIWVALIFLPSLGLIPALRMPQGIDPFAGAVLLAWGVNVALLVLVSLLDFPNPVERMQGLSFVHAIAPNRSPLDTGGARAEALLTLAGRLWGNDRALQMFRAAAAAQGKSGYLPDLTPRFLSDFERQMAGSTGAATAVALMARVTGRDGVTVADLMEVAGEASRARADNLRLENASEELAKTARKLQETNDKLTAVSAQKDAFLGQISHELRTPMTSIRAFSEIMMEKQLSDADRARFAGIIHDETGRLTRLIDDLLDLAVLEGGQARLQPRVVNLHDLIQRALMSANATGGQDFTLIRDIPAEHLMLMTDPDRLLQVLINVVTNAHKYCKAPLPLIRIETRRLRDGTTEIDISDNGAGIPAADQALIFEKFARLDDPARAGGAGLGLAICREIMQFLGGSIAYLPGQGGAGFRIALPRHPPGGENAAIASG